jgi:hypothetical protein
MAQKEPISNCRRRQRCAFSDTIDGPMSRRQLLGGSPWPSGMLRAWPPPSKPDNSLALGPVPTAQKSKAPDFSEARPYQRAGYIRPRSYQFFILTTVAD